MSLKAVRNRRPPKRANRRYNHTCKSKTRFHELEQAKDALRHIRYTNASGGSELDRELAPQRVYFCPDCFGYHLTSQPLIEELSEVAS